ncbi:outer membrane porin, OprD family [Stutzerimonas kirkiae]|uniref:Outer membrane porin, OprD family n=1 Tax=Stutzerimonas kirkiae TaxID=2211392 RepID=A0A4V2KCZ8_9GAMM|nr:OprD family porin [Stutzerimonas kirkiae]TBU96890.1 outer membrane porin, OprD family [Stutzerimonas kirkiae]TBV00512.1 outer membrane porin, OprD family [Stutzerimonas kirkiae]
MERTRSSLAILVALLPAAVTHAAFIEDSTASLGLRNFYINQDTRNQRSASVEEWGQGFTFAYRSGFTEGTVGVGLDALGLYGIRLDSGGRAGKNGISRSPGSVFPLDRDNRAVDEFGHFGLTGKLRISKSQAQFGTLLPKMPVLVHNDGRLLPQTFEGGQITIEEIDGLRLLGGMLEHSVERASTDKQGLKLAGSGADSNSFRFAGADYQLTRNLLVQYYYANLEDFYKQHFLGLGHDLKLAAGTLKTDLRYFDSGDDGANGNSAGRVQGYASNGYWRTGDASRGQVDNRLWSIRLGYSVQGHSLAAGYQRVSGNSDFPRLNQGQGESVYLITDAQLGKFANAGEKTWVGEYAYDFASLGVPGLKASLKYFSGDDIRAADSRREWERDIRLDYQVASGPLKGLGFSWRNATLRGNDSADRDEHRLILSYSIPLL